MFRKTASNLGILFALCATFVCARPAFGDTAYLVLYHGTTADNAYNIVSGGIQNVGNPANTTGLGLYVSADPAVAEAYAARQAVLAAADGLTGDAAQPIVIQCVVSTDGLSIGDFYLSKSQFRSDLANGVIGRDADLIQDALNRFDVINITGTEHYVGHASETQWSVLHASANPNVKFVLPPGADTAVANTPAAAVFNETGTGLDLLPEVGKEFLPELGEVAAKVLTNPAVGAVLKVSSVVGDIWYVYDGVKWTNQQIDETAQAIYFVLSNMPGTIFSGAVTSPAPNIAPTYPGLGGFLQSIGVANPNNTTTYSTCGENCVAYLDNLNQPVKVYVARNGYTVDRPDGSSAHIDTSGRVLYTDLGDGDITFTSQATSFKSFNADGSVNVDFDGSSVVVSPNYNADGSATYTLPDGAQTTLTRDEYDLAVADAQGSQASSTTQGTKVLGMTIDVNGNVQLTLLGANQVPTTLPKTIPINNGDGTYSIYLPDGSKVNIDQATYQNSITQAQSQQDAATLAYMNSISTTQQWINMIQAQYSGNGTGNSVDFNPTYDQYGNLVALSYGGEGALMMQSLANFGPWLRAWGIDQQLTDDYQNWLQSQQPTYYSGPTSSSQSRGSYVGCYSDSETRALPSLLATGSQMTVETCIAQAKAQNFKYAGLQFGGQCFAGNTVGYTRADDSECNMGCAGDSTEACGGSYLNSVYLSGASGATLVGPLPQTGAGDPVVATGPAPASDPTPIATPLSTPTPTPTPTPAAPTIAPQVAPVVLAPLITSATDAGATAGYSYLNVHGSSFASAGSTANVTCDGARVDVLPNIQGSTTDLQIGFSGVSYSRNCSLSITSNGLTSAVFGNVPVAAAFAPSLTPVIRSVSDGGAAGGYSYLSISGANFASSGNNLSTLCDGVPVQGMGVVSEGSTSIRIYFQGTSSARSCRVSVYASNIWSGYSDPVSIPPAIAVPSTPAPVVSSITNGGSWGGNTYLTLSGSGFASYGNQVTLRCGSSFSVPVVNEGNPSYIQVSVPDAPYARNCTAVVTSGGQSSASSSPIWLSAAAPPPPPMISAAGDGGSDGYNSYINIAGANFVPGGNTVSVRCGGVDVGASVSQDSSETIIQVVFPGSTSAMSCDVAVATHGQWSSYYTGVFIAPGLWW